MLITLSGRKSSGKSTLADELCKRGFIRVSFADRLKELTATLFNWEIKELYSTHKKEEIMQTPCVWDKSVSRKLEALIGAIRPLRSDKVVFPTRRSALQFIGTEVLRSYDSEFHVKEFIKKVSNEQNYVSDDVRFPNELEAVRRVGGTPIFVLRPYYFDYSNHASEISVRRHDFDYVVLNDGSKHQLLRKFNMFADTLIKPVKASFSRSQFLEDFAQCGYSTSELAAAWGCSRDKIIWWATKYCVNIPRNDFPLNHSVFSVFTPESAYWAGLLSADGSVKHHQTKYLLELGVTDRELVSGFQKFLKTSKPISTMIRPGAKPLYTVSISSPYLVDDLKLWNLEPRKSRFNKIPDCIRDNSELLSCWIIGLIDGDGSVFTVDGGKSCCITVLASKEIISFVQPYVGIRSCVEPEKDVENLFSLRYHGKYAIEFYRKIYRGVGLSRKWNALKPFLTKTWHH